MVAVTIMVEAGTEGVGIPVVALLISTVVESFHWHATTFLGLALCLGGNVLVLRMDRGKGKAAKAAQAAKDSSIELWERGRCVVQLLPAPSPNWNLPSVGADEA